MKNILTKIFSSKNDLSFKEVSFLEITKTTKVSDEKGKAAKSSDDKGKAAKSSDDKGKAASKETKKK